LVVVPAVEWDEDLEAEVFFGSSHLIQHIENQFKQEKDQIRTQSR
jgi:hypothetical protein